MEVKNYKIVKNPTTYKEQIGLLKQKGIIIENEAKSIEILANFNYYTFTGYLSQFKDKDGKYINNISFKRIYEIYLFDRKFRHILSQIIEIIEMSLKTKIAYISAHKIGSYGYMNKENFKNEKEFEIFLSKFEKLKKKNKNLDYVKHHNENYDGKMPIWVAINLFSLGMIYNYYKNIFENTNKNKMNIRKELAKEYNTGVRQLESWIENILYIRNMSAHYMRIYNLKLQKTPIKCYKNHQDNYIVSNRIFDIVHIMKFLVLDEKEWQNILINMSSLIENYEKYIDIDLLGFPKNWEDILKK